ncbi:MAG: hypothetical protein K6G07_05875 [Lachnospiraceae bacterium]|nr:hypothetical protein [Lachnospiraceae bacterium]
MENTEKRERQLQMLAALVFLWQGTIWLLQRDAVLSAYAIFVAVTQILFAVCLFLNKKKLLIVPLLLDVILSFMFAKLFLGFITRTGMAAGNADSLTEYVLFSVAGILLLLMVFLEEFREGAPDILWLIVLGISVIAFICYVVIDFKGIEIADVLPVFTKTLSYAVLAYVLAKA